jgi:D-aspartate ligase
MRPTALVMNMYYTGLGIARSLGERGIPVVGLSAQHGIYGNYTRYARIEFCPDSRREPAALLAWLIEFGRRTDSRSVIFPTRDDDVVFLDRFREELEAYFILAVPRTSVLKACLDKSETCEWARRAGVPAPQCWLIKSREDLGRVLPNLTYPCVLKPVEAHHWREADNWKLVGGRKAVGVSSQAELLAEYKTIAQADPRVLVQEMVPGSDNCLVIAACYLDQQSKYAAGFNTQKLVQIPEGFGTGCIVQGVERPELLERSARLLEKMKYTGIAEVEYKWDAAKNDYQLIEINPRPWDQHRLGWAAGVDLIYQAYCDLAGLAAPSVQYQGNARKWVAEDAYFTAVLRSLWRRDPLFFRLLRLARGKRIYAIWSWRDPLPALIYMTIRLFPSLIADGVRVLWSSLKRSKSKGIVYEQRLENEKSHV